MPLCVDREPLRPVLQTAGIPALSVFNLVFGRAGAPAPRVWVDDRHRPRAVVCRGRRFYLWATDSRAAGRLIRSLPRRSRLNFGATPLRFYRLIRRNWPGPDCSARVWTNPCFMFVLDDPRRLRAPGHRVEPLRPDDAPLIVSQWPYGRSRSYVASRIRRLPAVGIRRRGQLVAWALTHDDGSMGFLHVLAEYRGRGMARSLTVALCKQLLRLGLLPFNYIVQTNRASIKLTTSMGFRRVGEYGWFGSEAAASGRRAARLPSAPASR
uniref:GNAT family N-acetyltransferase n=1 Tax=candidate division WOR-3 bacterium TaxID=2052148 RepID=A0A7C4CAR7_UNCW3